MYKNGCSSIYLVRIYNQLKGVNFESLKSLYRIELIKKTQ